MREDEDSLALGSKLHPWFLCFMHTRENTKIQGRTVCDDNCWMVLVHSSVEVPYLILSFH